MLKRLANFLRTAKSVKYVDSMGLKSRDDLSMVVPLIKSVGREPEARVESEETIRLSFEESPVTRTFAADMILMYALDRADWLEYVSNGAIEQLGVSKEELHARAIEDLPNRLPPIEVHDCGGGVVGLSAGGSFEASLLLVDRLWQDLAKHLVVFDDDDAHDSFASAPLTTRVQG